MILRAYGWDFTSQGAGEGGEGEKTNGKKKLSLNELVEVVQTGDCAETRLSKDWEGVKEKSVPSGAPSQTTRSACRPLKWLIICSAVLVLVMSPSIWTTPGRGA